MIHYGKSHQSQGKDSLYKWAVVGLLVVATLMLGYFGFREHADMHHEHTSFISALYHTIQLFALHSPISLRDKHEARCRAVPGGGCLLLCRL